MRLHELFRHAPQWAKKKSHFAALLAVSLVLACASKRRDRGPEAAPVGVGSLAVRVDPPQGISVLLDGNRVAESSPYVSHGIAAGSHVLEVRGMGRFPVSLPFAMQPNGQVDVPVVLRTRTPTPWLPNAEPGASAQPEHAPAAPELLPPQGAAARPSRQRPHPVPVTSNRPGRPLPPGSTPLRIAVAPTPPVRIVADGVEMASTDVRLNYGQGSLQVGEMRFTYRVYPGRAVELTVPQEPMPWFLGEQQIKAKSVVRLSASAIVLHRGEGANQQQAWMRRLE